MSTLKNLFKTCFSPTDPIDVQEPFQPTFIPSTSSTTSRSSTEKTPLKVIARPTVTRIATPLTQNALTFIAKHTYYPNSFFPVPEIQNGEEVLIRNCAVGLNPIDWKSVNLNFCLPAFLWVTGREMSGIVEEIGENVTDLKVGERVWTSTYYRDIRSGCFQQYVIAPAYTVQRIPPSLSFEQAACLGVCGLTAAMTLWKWLEVPMHEIPQPSASSSPRYMLIWGGSSVIGQFAVQITSYSGFDVIAVASEKTRDLVSGLGARHVVTRDNKTNSSIVAEIRAIAGDGLTLAKLACKLALLSFLPKGFVSQPNVEVHSVEMNCFTVDRECRKYAVALNRLIGKGLIRLPELEVLDGGLGRVEEGLELQK